MSGQNQLPGGLAIRGVPRVDGLVCRLITEPDDVEKLTYVRTCDCRTALARGLAEYLAAMSFTAEGGRRVAWEAAMVTWAEPEQTAKHPSFAVTALTPGTYGDSSMAPSQTVVADGSGRYLRAASGFTQPCQLVVWAADPMSRMSLVTLIEDAMTPVEWMSGARLELPYYFGTRATYLLLDVIYDDSPEQAQQRWSRAVFNVNAELPQYVPVGGLPDMHLRVDVVAED